MIIILTPEQAQELGLTISLVMVMGGVTAFLIAYCRSRYLYVSLASTVTIMVIIGPLFQTQQASAFFSDTGLLEG